MCNILVDFTDIDEINRVEIKQDRINAVIISRPEDKNLNIIIHDNKLETNPILKSEKIFNKTEYHNLFDFETQSRYKAFRIKLQDPITCEDLTDQNAFKFYNVWDCLTGERIGIDPYGPLYLSPVSIFRNIYANILKGLWIEMVNCVPMYGEVLGCGEDFYVPGKGAQPEKYLFRFPIKDCYIYKEQDGSIHTMGPKFTDDEINKLDNLINKYWYNDPFIESTHINCTLKRLKSYYNVAISKKPTLIEPLPEYISNIYFQKIAMNHISIDHNTYLNRLAVDCIKSLIGYRSPYY
jgi:hypothetical protein